MNEFTRRRGGPRRRLTSSVVRLIRQVTAIVRELNEAQRLATSRRLSPDLYLTDPDRAPDTYAEFVFRSPIAPRREPRAAGAPPSSSSSTRSS